MKKIAILLGIIFSITATSSAQTGHVKLKKLTNKDFVYALCNIDTITKKVSSYLSIVLYDVPNKSGSANLAGSDEITHHLLIAVSLNRGEDAKQNAYSVGDFYAPKIKDFNEVSKDLFELIIEDGAYNNRKTTLLNVGPNGIVIK